MLVCFNAEHYYFLKILHILFGLTMMKFIMSKLYYINIPINDQAVLFNLLNRDSYQLQ